MNLITSILLVAVSIAVAQGQSSCNLPQNRFRFSCLRRFGVRFITSPQAPAPSRGPQNFNRNFDNNFDQNFNQRFGNAFQTNLRRPFQDFNRGIRAGFDARFNRRFGPFRNRSPATTRAPVRNVFRPQAPTRPPTIRTRPTPRPRNQFRPAPTRAPQRTRAPITRAPVQRGPVTRVPIRRPPVTRSPFTRAPVRQQPVTRAPVTNAPVTRAPVTRAPVTRAPVTTTRAPVPQRQPATRTNAGQLGPIRSELQGMMRNNVRLIPAWVQLGFHACVGGCDGCLDLTEPDNKGLTGTYRQLREVHAKHNSSITLADLVALAAVEAGNSGIQRGGGSTTIQLRIGRSTCANPDRPNKSGEFPKGKDPNAIGLLQREFGISRVEAVTLLGAHSLGRCTPGNSGFDGQWDNTPNALDNGFYRSLAGTNWVTAASPGGSTQWVADRNNIAARMMLHSDMAIAKQFTVSGGNDQPSCTSACPASGDMSTVRRFSGDQADFHRAFADVFDKMLSKTSDTLTRV